MVDDLRQQDSREPNAVVDAEMFPSTQREGRMSKVVAIVAFVAFSALGFLGFLAFT